MSYVSVHIENLGAENRLRSDVLGGPKPYVVLWESRIALNFTDPVYIRQLIETLSEAAEKLNNELSRIESDR